MEYTFRRANRISALPRVAVMERKMCRAAMNIHIPSGVFIITNVPFVLLVTGVL